MKFIRGDLFAEIADFCYTDMNNDEDYLKSDMPDDSINPYLHVE